VPMGTLNGYSSTRPTLRWTSTQVFPGSSGFYWVYVPAQWDKTTPLPLLVLLNGGQFLNPNGPIAAWAVWDNLIAQKKIRPFIAIAMTPGNLGAAVEYFANDDKTSQFVLNEIIPLATTQFNLKLLTDRRFRAIGGNAGGAYGALKVALKHPDQFSQVITEHLDLPMTDPLLGLVTTGPQLDIYAALFSSQMDRVGTGFLANALQTKGYRFFSSVGDDFRDSSDHLGAFFPKVMECTGW
jgi:Putative esterase